MLIKFNKTIIFTEQEQKDICSICQWYINDQCQRKGFEKPNKNCKLINLLVSMIIKKADMVTYKQVKNETIKDVLRLLKENKI